MNTDLKLKINSTSSAQTEKIGSSIGKSLQGGEIILLQSDLGGGKTTITRGIVSGSGSVDMVSSPTFTISKEYIAPKFLIVHYDFYRLEDPGIMQHELEEHINDSGKVVIIEWGDIVLPILPKSIIKINLNNMGGDKRLISVDIPNNLKYIAKALR